MYNLSQGSPHKLKLTITRGALKKKKKLTKKRWRSIEEKGEVEWMDLCIHQIQCR
jgi:hypothetical protein